MSYLYLNFNKYLESLSKNPRDFYATSLNEQYDKLRKKIEDHSKRTIQEFFNCIMSDYIERDYYISMPALYREPIQNNNSSIFINNVVIRPEHDSYISTYLPDKYDLILVGDIRLGNMTEIVIKGIDLIDVDIMKYGEEMVRCYACCAFETKTLPNGKPVPNYNGHRLHEEVLTADFIDNLCNNVTPLPKEKFRQAKAQLKKWQDYIDFRYYYLQQQSKECKDIDKVQVLDTYTISRSEYKQNKQLYEDKVFNQSWAKNSEQVILSEQINRAERYPLICVTIDKNKKQIYQELVRETPKYQIELGRYTRQPVSLAKSKPEYYDDGVLKNIKDTYSLGDRYKFSHCNVLPDLTDLQDIFTQKYQQAKTEIDNKYQTIISNEVQEYLSKKKEEINASNERRISEEKSLLAKTFEQDVANNNDIEVKKEYDEEIARLSLSYEK